MSTATAVLSIRGMSCTGCAATVEGVLDGTDGVLSSVVNFGAEKATIEYDPERVTLSVLDSALKAHNYSIVTERITIPVTGMHCASCVGTIEGALAGHEGIVSVSASMGLEKTTVEYLPGTISPREITSLIGALGYEATLPPETGRLQGTAAEASKRDELAALKKKVVACAVISVIVFSGSMKGISQFVPGLLSSWYTLFALATVVQLWGGWVFYRGTWAALRSKRADMNTLIAMGSSAAYLYSVIATFFPTLVTGGSLSLHVYFDTSVLIITLILLGRYLEMRSRVRTNDSLRKLMDLTPRSARVIRDGAELDIPTDGIIVGDLIITRPGERFATDGVIAEGTAMVDQSMLTGEATAVVKQIGDRVMGGTINQATQVKVRATGVGSDTLLAQIIRLVEEAISSKAPVERLVDRIAAVFVPAVIAIAAVTFLVWLYAGPDPSTRYAFVNFIAVLVVACPCALGLATPTATMVGIGRGAERGILIKTSTALELASGIKTVIFDKTGTLTRGSPELVGVIAPDGDEDKYLALAASAERDSLHPLAGAVIEGAQKRGLRLRNASDTETIPGVGISAVVEGKGVVLGNRRMMERAGVDTSAMSESVAAMTEAGSTPVYVAIDGAIKLVLAIKDPIKPESAGVVSELASMGIGTVMLTGDTRHTAEAIARELGIERVISDVLPAAKAAAVEAEKERAGDGLVAMVGDGINDAPALTTADIGIAVGAGEDIAIESADIVLLGSDITGVPDSVKLSRATTRTITQNLFFAFFYNVLLIPMAAGALFPFFGVLLSPVFAAGAMAASSVSVVTNSLRLRRAKLEHTRPPTES